MVDADRQRTDGRRLDGYTISSSCEPNGSGELIVTAKLICVLVFAYAKIRFSHDAAHIMAELENIPLMPAHSRTIVCLKIYKFNSLVRA